MTTRIPVFYTPKMVADSESMSPSAAKPAKVVDSWLKQFPVEVIEPSPASRYEIARAHDPKWVDKVLACEADNGFANRSPAVAASLPYTSGAMLSAARHAIQTGKVAAAPCSGFHHAEHARPMGFCTFNGLMVTALALRAEGLAKTVGILDLDMHYGNGTDHILNKVGNDDKWCRHFTAGLTIEYPTQVKEFFADWLPNALLSLAGCDVVLYQAGADPHIMDPFGGWMETDEMRLRDAIVFDSLSRNGVPVVWNLAGGYQVKPDGSIPAVLEIHDNTMRECVRVYI
jgi:acetoin utilization deacetylase AcuC-like enzyme